MNQDRQDQYKYSIEMNNLGASCIQSGDYESAIHHLTNAFKASKIMLAGAAHHQQPIHDDEGKLKFCMLPTPPCKLSDDIANDHGETWGIIQGAIHIHLEHALTVRSYEAKRTVAVIILFNLILAHQLLSAVVNTHPSSSRIWTVSPSRVFLLDKAISLYQTAIHLQQSCGLISMSAMVNLSQIHWSQGKLECSAKYMHQLDAMTSWRAQAYHGTPSSLELHIQHMIYMIRQGRYAAAAAA